MNYKTKLYKSLRCSSSRAKENVELAAKYGFQGVEITGVREVTEEQGRQLRAFAEDRGVRIHSVSFGWVSLNQPEAVAQDIEAIRKGLRLAAACGADAILLVPSKIELPGVLPPSGFRIAFDPKNARIDRVVEGDNTAYREYIKLHNEATDCCRRYVEEVVPEAAACGVTIALENVWSNLWVTPSVMAAFVKSFDCRWVKAYLDLGNNLKYAPTQDWLVALGAAQLAKLHIKDFVCMSPPEVPAEKGGKFVPIGQGNIDWVSVRNVIEKIGYNGWVTLEDVRFYTPEEHAQILDDFFAGRPMKLARELRGKKR
ncbi:MAG: sugar phosphate isomerase/epimerase [Thermoguttaceae bacterium]|nr:sugar phosphate isomerase/epimerase [Thermoguttaceae bacterium]